MTPLGGFQAEPSAEELRQLLAEVRTAARRDLPDGPPEVGAEMGLQVGAEVGAEVGKFVAPSVQERVGTTSAPISGGHARSSPARSLAGVDLAQFDREADLARALAREIAISGEEHTPSIVTIADTKLVVTLWLDFDERWKVRILKRWPAEGKKKPRTVLTLAETYAAWITQELRSLSDSEHAQYKLRMLVDLGRIPAVHVELT
jgi:hypothetical protein